jgi:hypothetical protein
MPIPDAASENPPTSNVSYAVGAPRLTEPDVGELSRAAAGDPAAFRSLVERYQHIVFGCAYVVLGDRQDAEDAAQEAFLRLHRSLRQYRGEAGFGTWLAVAPRGHGRDRPPSPSAAPHLRHNGRRGA